MSAEILTINTPMPAGDPNAPGPFEIFEADLNGDGQLERIEIETAPRSPDSPFREWRVYQGGENPIAILAGVEVSVERVGGGRSVIRSDGAIWTLSDRFGLIPYEDLLAPRTKFMKTGTAEDQALLQAFGAPGIFRENVLVITVSLDGERGEHRVIAGSGFAFMDEASDTSPFLITSPDLRPIFAGWGTTHPWIFRNGENFTIVAKNRFGYQITLFPGELFS